MQLQGCTPLPLARIWDRGKLHLRTHLCRFSNVFVGKDLRIARDSRGDTLIVARDGPPRKFT